MRQELENIKKDVQAKIKEKIASKKNREDGRATREHLLECAGKLIAEQGFAKTTSKEICALAGENVAAINYHFGSRDGLYQELLENVHQYLLNAADLERLVNSDVSPRKKIEIFIRTVALKALQENSWQLHLWIRELTNPTPYLESFVENRLMRKRILVIRMISDYTGLDFDDARLYTAVLSFGAPFALLLLFQRQDVNLSALMPVKIPLEELVKQMEKFVFAGLDALKVN